MNKLDFLLELHEKIIALPEEDIERSLDYYSEMIDDRMEDGLREEEAVAAVGEPAEIAAQIMAEIPLGKLVKAKLKPRRAPQAWKVVLLVLGSPLWIPLLAAVLVVILAIYIVIWSLVISLYAVDLASAVLSLAWLAAAVMHTVGGNTAAGVFMLGGSLVFAGLAIFMFLACDLAGKGALRLGKITLRGIRSCFIGKEAAK